MVLAGLMMMMTITGAPTLTTSPSPTTTGVYGRTTRVLRHGPQGRVGPTAQAALETAIRAALGAAVRVATAGGPAWMEMAAPPAMPQQQHDESQKELYAAAA